MTVLVTGGTGFVGPKVVHALRTEERAVRVLARKPDRQTQLSAWGCELVQGDMTDAESLQRAVEGCDAVIHLVALAPFADPQATRRVMEQGTRDLVAAAKDAGVRRFVLMSALGTSERTQSVSAYYAAKWDEEEAVRESGLDHTIFRPSFVFGRDGGLLPGLIRMVRWSPVNPVFSTRKLQPIWAADVASYFAKALDAANDGVFEIAGPDVVTWRELIERIRRALGKRRVAFQVPGGVLRAGAAAGQLLPPFRGARGAIAMLEDADNTTDITPAVEAFGIRPVGLDDQLRRALA